MATAPSSEPIPLMPDADGVIRVGATRVTLDAVIAAFQDDATLERASAVLEAQSYRTHEFGDSMLIARRQARRMATRPSVMPASHTASQKLASMV